jgi:hypothetical protein
MKKLVGIFVIMLLTATAILSALGKSNNSCDINITSFNGDELDQYQEIHSNYLHFVCNDYTVAQSFVPNFPTLTKVEVMLYKWETRVDYELTVSIREELNGENLTQLTKNPDINPEQTWVEYNLEDINVIPGNTYYIVCSATEGSPDYGGRNEAYGWYFNFDSNSYPDGATYLIGIHSDYNWIGTQYDSCFRTYGIPNNSPNKPTITGETNGKFGESYEYTFYSTDPDGDELYYWILWFDDCPSVSWDGPYSSGEEITKSYSWENEGTYNIQVKTKDSYGAESEWTKLVVIMPKNKSINGFNTWFSRLIERDSPILELLL